MYTFIWFHLQRSIITSHKCLPPWNQTSKILLTVCTVCTVCTVLLKTKPSPASNYLYISSLSFCRPNACTTKQINIRAIHIQKIDHCTLIPLQRRHNPQIILLICTFRLELKFTHVSFFFDEIRATLDHLLRTKRVWTVHFVRFKFQNNKI